MKKHKNYLLLGSGISSLGAAKWIKRLGGSVTLSDSNPIPQEKKKKWENFSDFIIEGSQDTIELKNYDVVIVSPGIPLNKSPLIQQARVTGIPVLSDLDLSLPSFKGNLIGVTGTNGKSTTVSLINHVLKNLGFTSEEAGNIGVSPSQVLIERDKHPECMVVELSSYQLESLCKSRFDCTVFTSFAYDHIERHGSLKNYLITKWKLSEATKPNGFRILSSNFAKALRDFNISSYDHDNNIIVGSRTEIERLNPSKSDTAFFDANEGLLVFQNEKIRFDRTLGYFSMYNKSLAILAVKSVAADISFEEISNATNGFKGLPHRQQEILSTIKYPCKIIDDSKSTNVESTMAALRSFDKSCYLLLGGVDKGESFSELNKYKDQILKCYCFGSSRMKLSSQLHRLNLEVYETCHDALRAAGADAKSFPAIILFSPGCSSFDEFENFEHRGIYFQKEILSILKE